jgi:putative ATP-binding cassette transporter
MGLIAQVLQLLFFLHRWTPGLRYARLKVTLVILTGIISGLSNAALIAVINRALGRHGTDTTWIFIGLCFVLSVSRFISGAVLFQLSANAVFQMRMHLSRKIVAAPLRSLEELGPHRLLATLTEDVPTLTAALTWFPTFLMQVFVVFGLLLYVGWLSRVALAALLVFLVVGVTTYQLPMKSAAKYLTASRQGWDELMKHLRSLVEGTKELKLHSRRRECFFVERLEKSADVLRSNSVIGQMAFLGATAWGHILFMILIGLIVLLFPAHFRVEGGVLSGSVLAILYMMGPLQGIMEALPTLGRATVAMQTIERLGISLREDTTEESLATPPEAWSDGQTLELAGVTHGYYSGTEDRGFTMGPIDLVIETGELVFLTGGNGSGKTTLAKIITGLYVPEQGELRLGGRRVTDANREAFRQQFAAVFSDFFLFESLLGFEHPGLDEQARSYLRTLRLAHKVSVTGGALSTIDLSQGQRKRLALLTAYLENRPIYLFDEWAADQDPEFKDVFYLELLPGLKARGRTVIVISHDDRYFHVADRIIKLEFGKVVLDAPVEANRAVV